MARRRLTPAGLAGAGVMSAVAAWTAVNRAAVRRLSRGPDTVRPADMALPAGVLESTVEMSDGWVLRILERGPADGPPVVLLHGITLGAEVWPYQLDELADRGLRVIAVDQRGHGGSGGAGPQPPEGPGAPDLTLDRLAADAAELLERLDLRRAVLVGHSMGGMVALRMMAADPDLAAGRGRVAGLLLVATASNATRRRGVPGLGDALALAQPLLSSASGVAARLPGPTLPAHDLAFLLARVTFGAGSSPNQVNFTGRLTSEVPVRVSAGLILEILRFDADAVLPGIGLPATVMVGDHDLMTPLAQSEHMAARIPGAVLEVLPGCGHMVMLERPAELNRAVVDLVDRRPIDARGSVA